LDLEYPGSLAEDKNISSPTGVEVFGLQALNLSNLHETKYGGDIVPIKFVE